MTALDELKTILNNEYMSDDGDLYRITLLEGFTATEIDNFRDMLPNGYLPEEMEELLKFTRGFEFYGLDEVRFDSFGQFGFEVFFPYSIQLAGDGFGNYWILDIDSKGCWNEVYYVCHDPAVVVKHSESLAQFIKHIDDLGKNGANSNLDTIHEKVVFDIWQKNTGIMEYNEKNYQFPESIMKKLPISFLIADLTNQPIQTGFAWGKHDINRKIIRVDDKPIWILEKRVNTGFFGRLFNR